MSFLKQQCTNHEVRDGIYAMPYMITCVARPIPIGTYSKRTIYSQLLARLNISRPNIMKSRNETEKKLEKRKNEKTDQNKRTPMVLTKYIENDCGKQMKTFFFSRATLESQTCNENFVSNSSKQGERKSLLLFHSCARSTMRETIIKLVYYQQWQLTWLNLFRSRSAHYTLFSKCIK